MKLSVFGPNPHYLAVDDSPVFPIGATHANAWTAVSIPDHDFVRDMDRMSGVIERIGSARVVGLVRVSPFFARRGYLMPWRQEADGKYRLDEFDARWCERLTAYLQTAAARRLIVSLEIWDDCSATFGPEGMYDLGPDVGWAHNPFHPARNDHYDRSALGGKLSAKDIPFYSTVPPTEATAPVLHFQQLYVDELLRIAGPFDNVIFNLSNETRATLAWSRYWAGYLRGKLGRGRLIGEMPSTNRRDGRGEYDPALNPEELIGDEAYDFVDVAQAVNSHELGREPLAQSAAAGARLRQLRGMMDKTGTTKPLVCTKDYTNTDPDGVPVIWAKFVGGAGCARFHRPHPWTPHDDLEAMADFDFRAIEHLGRFVADVAFETMRADVEFVDSLPEGMSANGLVRAGEEYIVQLIGAGKGKLRVALEGGRYDLRFYDPHTGKYVGTKMSISTNLRGAGELDICVKSNCLIARITR